jgi:hypothetical protein
MDFEAVSQVHGGLSAGTAFATTASNRQRMSRGGTAAAMERQSIGQSRALVPISPARATRTPGRAHATFLVHLIATRRELPQTRARRRTEPADAARAYRAGLARPGPRPVLSRSL